MKKAFIFPLVLPAVASLATFVTCEPHLDKQLKERSHIVELTSQKTEAGGEACSCEYMVDGEKRRYEVGIRHEGNASELYMKREGESEIALMEVDLRMVVRYGCFETTETEKQGRRIGSFVLHSRDYNESEENGHNYNLDESTTSNLIFTSKNDFVIAHEIVGNKIIKEDDPSTSLHALYERGSVCTP